MKTLKNLSRQRVECKAFFKPRLVAKAEQARAIVVIFTLCGLLMSTSLGMVAPVFAHLLKETSSGVRSLSLMTMIPQIALFALAPFIGELEDRYGKRPFLLLGFAGLVVTNIGYLFAHSVTAYIGIRLFQAIVSVGIIPATLGMLADVVPEQQRMRRISLIMAGHAGGLTLGPTIGGFLLSRWGAIAPFSVAALLNLVVLCLVCTMLPRTSVAWTYHQEAPRRKALSRKNVKLLLISLMLPLSFFVGLLVLDFVSAFGRTFVEPQQALYFYKVLKFTPVQFGFIMSSHGLAMLLGLLILSLRGDRANKRMMIVIGFLSHAFLIFYLLFAHQFASLLLVSLCAGIGGGMVKPLLSACYLASTTPHYRSSIIGIKEAVVALGEIAGSLVVVLASPWLIPQRTFIIGGCIVVGAGLLALIILKSYRVMLPSSTMQSNEIRPDGQLADLSGLALNEVGE